MGGKAGKALRKLAMEGLDWSTTEGEAEFRRRLKLLRDERDQMRAESREVVARRVASLGATTTLGGLVVLTARRVDVRKTSEHGSVYFRLPSGALLRLSDHAINRNSFVEDPATFNVVVTEGTLAEWRNALRGIAQALRSTWGSEPLRERVILSLRPGDDALTGR